MLASVDTAAWLSNFRMFDSLRYGDFIALCAETWREGALLFQSWLILEPTTGGLYVGSI